MQSTTTAQEREEVKGEDDPPEDAFLMVTQQRWEDKILWDTPYTPGPAYTGAGIGITSSVHTHRLSLANNDEAKISVSIAMT